MGGNGPLDVRKIAGHFFRHAGADDQGPDEHAALLDKIEQDLRRDGALGDDEILGFAPRKLDEVEKTDPDLAERKRSLIQPRER